MLRPQKSQDLKNVIVRLGRFHLLMSYLESIGQIMAGSGLETLWETVYAKGTIVHMLSGHAFSLALRAHILTLVVLINVLIDDFASLDTIDIDHLKNLYSKIVKQEEKIEDVIEDSSMINFGHIVSQLLDQAAEQSRTGKL